MAEACRLTHLGWTARPVVNALMLDYPTLHVDQARAIQLYAQEACAAAALIRELPLDHVHLPTDVPRIGG